MSDPIPPHTVPHPEGQGEVITETRAKQGRGGRHMMVVMGVSLALVAVAFAVIWLVYRPGGGVHLALTGGQKPLASARDLYRRCPRHGILPGSEGRGSR